MNQTEFKKIIEQLNPKFGDKAVITLDVWLKVFSNAVESLLNSQNIEVQTLKERVSYLEKKVFESR